MAKDIFAPVKRFFNNIGDGIKGVIDGIKNGELESKIIDHVLIERKSKHLKK